LSRNALVPKTLSPFRFFGDLDLKVAGRPMALSAIETQTACLVGEQACSLGRPKVALSKHESSTL